MTSLKDQAAAAQRKTKCLGAFPGDKNLILSAFIPAITNARPVVQFPLRVVEEMALRQAIILFVALH